MNTRRLTILAMLIAIYSVLSILTPIEIINFKLTFEAFPILVASLLLGPIEGLIVGGVGSFIYQVLFSGYGITATTFLWIIPHALSGLVVGLYAKKKNFEYSDKGLFIICCVSSIIVTTFNCLALYIDSKIYNYYSFVLVFGNLIIKYIMGCILGILFGLALPKILKFFNKLNIRSLVE